MNYFISSVYSLYVYYSIVTLINAGVLGKNEYEQSLMKQLYSEWPIMKEYKNEFPSLFEQIELSS